MLLREVKFLEGAADQKEKINLDIVVVQPEQILAKAMEEIDRSEL